SRLEILSQIWQTRAGSFSILSFQSTALLAATAIGAGRECFVREIEIQSAGFRCAEFRSSPERNRDRSPPAVTSRNEPERVLPRTTFPSWRGDRSAFACPPEHPRRETKLPMGFASSESAVAARRRYDQSKYAITALCFQ